MEKFAIEVVRHELEQALVHLTQASDVLARYLDDDQVYQVWCLTPISGVERTLYYLRALSPKDGK